MKNTKIKRSGNVKICRAWIGQEDQYCYLVIIMKIHTFNPKPILLCAAFVTFLQMSAFCQKYDRIFKICLDELNLEYTLPAGFSERDSTTSFKCKDDLYNKTTTLVYSVINKDSSIIIGFGDFIRDRGQQYYEPVSNILKRQKSEADSLHFSSLVYHQQKADKKFNADNAVEYTKNCSDAFLDKYNNDRYVLAARKGKGEFTIVFYFTDAAKDKALQLVREASGILKFRKNQ
ncbi:hypothetical protein [Pedobacter sp.]|uniref:hypothetical protein n=1 Tax=Pedobacter sp. TaxID=1411316 RepID=UPI003BAAA60C